MSGRPSPIPVPRTDARSGDFIELDGELHARIADFDRMPPFLMSLASDGDLWMYVSSNGGLTAGRGDAEGALFPYVTSDQLHDAHHHSGPLTLLRVERNGAEILWEPFASDAVAERTLYKNALGTRLVREEIRADLGLAFRSAWEAADEFGWVRTCSLHNIGPTPVRATLLDGLRNLLPHGATLGLYQTSSNLVDAYKRTELDTETGLGIVSLTAGITDRAEALESLRANVVWCCGLEDHRTHISPRTETDFRSGRVLTSEVRRLGGRGRYLVSSCLDLEPGTEQTWRLIGDVGLDHVQLVALRERLRDSDDLDGTVTAALRRSRHGLERLLAGADGHQLTERPVAWVHHAANVLFNSMRGGVVWRNTELPRDDFEAFLRTRNRPAAERFTTIAAELPETVVVDELLDRLRGADDPDLVRLALEYLPLHFGRRHGDPSRPWNRFSIRGRNGNGEPTLAYEGNWRDIFQNWEALAHSHPAFLPNMVAKFLNASTVDGFNPYRITRDGVDWEVVEPENPWSNIGYWGDHQIVYLTRLLEALRRYHPESCDRFFSEDVFSYADVPYRIRSYADLTADPRDTIDFDADLHRSIAERVAALGTDGRLVAEPDGSVRRANLLEKILVPVLAKLSNLIPDAGVWMNTQRPEWNDANNALAGGGASVVTLAHLRRHLVLLLGLLDRHADEAPAVAVPIAAWASRLASVLDREKGLLGAGPLSPSDRRRVVDDLGEAFSTYRDVVYADGLGERRPLPVPSIASLLQDALAWIDHSLDTNRRNDGLTHSYNVPVFGDDDVTVTRLPEMLEGQVALIGAGVLDGAEVLAILETLYDGPLYRPDQDSFLLSPARDLPGFLARNRVPEAAALDVPLLRDLIAAGDGALLARDAADALRFHADLINTDALDAALDRLASDPVHREAVARDRDAVHAVFESVFHHGSYTGRSGVMAGYEGLGCIYWHMVAKLLLAVQEAVLSLPSDTPDDLRDGLTAMYFRIRSGLGYERDAASYGAFPTDPYSHTPPDGVARQPGMTGQVKEEILTRRGELGLEVVEGRLRFRPALLRREEFLTRPAVFRSYGTSGDPFVRDLPADSLAFTLCQTPVIYERTAGTARIRVEFADGRTFALAGDTLDEETSRSILSRCGRVAVVTALIPDASLLD